MNREENLERRTLLDLATDCILAREDHDRLAVGTGFMVGFCAGQRYERDGFGAAVKMLADHFSDFDRLKREAATLAELIAVIRHNQTA